MNLKQYAAPIAAFAILVLGVILAFRANAFPSKVDAVDDISGPGQAATDPWVDSTGTQWVYSKNLNLWIAPTYNMFILTGTPITPGFMGIYSNAAAGDTTSATAWGFEYPESLVCTGTMWDFRKDTAPNCSLQVFVTAAGPTLVRIKDTSGGNSGRDNFTAAFSGPNESWNVYLKAKSSGAVNPSKPVVRLALYRFRRPTTP